MPRKTSIEDLIQIEKEKQDAVKMRIAELQREKQKEEKAKREKRMREIGRLAFQCGIGEMDLGELEVAFKSISTMTFTAQNVPAEIG